MTSPKTFPSRLALGTDGPTQHGQMRHLTNIFRRVYRIFAHAWFQHREMFWKVETRTGLYVFFKTVCDVYGLIPEDNYTIPSEAEGVEQSTEVTPAPIILRRDTDSSIEDASDHTLSTAGTTKRHRHSPSVGATAVSTVVEEAEEEEEPLTRVNTETEPVHTEAISETNKPTAEEGSVETSEPVANGKPDTTEESVSLTEAQKEDPQTKVDEVEKQGESDEEEADAEESNDKTPIDAKGRENTAESEDRPEATSASTDVDESAAAAEKAEKDDEAGDADKAEVKE